MIKFIILGMVGLFGIIGSIDSHASNATGIVKTGTQSTGTTSPIRLIRSKKIKPIQYGINMLNDLDLVIVKPQTRKHVFTQSGSTVKRLTEYNNAKYAINGSYFWREGTGAFYPAGTLGTGGKSKFNYKLCDDVNLCGIYNLDTLEITKNMISGSMDGNYRSSGPLLLWSGKVNEEIGFNKSHRQRKTYRTALVYSSNAPMFVFSKTGYTLPAFTNQLKKIFPNGNAINLDGGSSTSFYGPTDSFNSNKLLPEFFLMW